MAFDISKIKLFAFDLDGTIYIGNNVIPGAIELIDFLRSKYHVVFFTNNSTKTGKEICEKLNRLGIICKPNEVYASSTAASLYLRESGLDHLYVIGTESLCMELRANGLQIVENNSARHLVVGMDMNFNYTKIATALSVLLRGGRFIACNEDASFPVGKNEYMPGCGAMVAAIAASANRKPDFIIGKPNTFILSKIANTFGVKNNEIIVVGDSYESDIVMALNYKSKAVLIKSDNNNIKNDNVLLINNLYEILKYMRCSK